MPAPGRIDRTARREAFAKPRSHEFRDGASFAPSPFHENGPSWQWLVYIAAHRECLGFRFIDLWTMGRRAAGSTSPPANVKLKSMGIPSERGARVAALPGHRLPPPPRTPAFDERGISGVMPTSARTMPDPRTTGDEAKTPPNARAAAAEPAGEAFRAEEPPSFDARLTPVVRASRPDDELPTRRPPPPVAASAAHAAAEDAGRDEAGPLADAADSAVTRADVDRAPALPTGRLQNRDEPRAPPSARR